MWVNSASYGRLYCSKKLQVVAAEGDSATSVKTPVCVQCLCHVDKVVRCQKCSSGIYCSESCVKNHGSKHKQICSAIQDLEKLESDKRNRMYKNSENRKSLPSKLNREIIQLVGERPLLNVELDDVSCNCLWDTGSMVSIMSSSFRERMFPDKTLCSVDDFVGGETLSLSAANNSELPVEGVILLDFGVDGKNLFKVPFLVTNDELAHPIIGFNTIEHLILNFENKVPSLEKLLPHLSPEKLNNMVNVIEKASEIPENL